MTDKKDQSIYIKMRDFEPEWGGAGWVYIEFKDKWATRQVGVYPDKVLSSTEDSFITDQPLDDSEINIPNSEHIMQISGDEFNKIWMQYVKT